MSSLIITEFVISIGVSTQNPVADLGGPFFGDAYASSTAAVSSSGLKQPLPSPDHNEPQDRPKPGNAQTVNAAASKLSFWSN